MHHKSWRNGSIVAMVMLLVIGSLLTLSIAPASTVAAQDAPTATPRDPAWLGFSTARTAIEEEKEVDLSIVSRWDFFQDDWSTPNGNHPQHAAGIDSCVSTVIIAQGRPVYFGWTFVITSVTGEVYEARVGFDLNDVAICDILSVPVARAANTNPESTQEPNGNLPPPVAGSGLTGSFELGGHIAGLTAEAVSAMQRSGMRWIKEQVPLWAGAQYGIDRINAAHENGFKLLIGFVGDRDALGADPTGHTQTFAAMAAQMAAAGADAIEVWNEPNIDREWPTGQVSGASYTTLLATTYNAIKAANPNTIVISGAPAPTGFFGAAGCNANGCNDDVFMQQMADAGAAQYLDCVGIHYNEGVLPPSAYSGDPRGGYPSYFYGSMVARATAPFPGKPICFTELGYLSGEGMGAPIPPSFDWTPNDPITVAEQAAYLAEAASLSAQRGDIRIMIIWNVNFTRWDSDPMGGYAIIRPNGSCPACDALGSVMGAGN
jgi:hypothetical protein